VLSAAHEVMPWTAAIAASTVAIRLALVPVTVVARRAGRRVAAAAPQLNELNAMLVQATRRNDVAGRQRAVAAYLRAVHRTLRVHRANPLVAFLLMPAVHIPTFVTLALSVRELANVAPGYCTGGALWFRDLAHADPYGVLPLVAVGTSYANLAAVGNDGEKLTIPVVLKHAVRPVPSSSLLTVGATLAHHRLSRHAPAARRLPRLLDHLHRVSVPPS